VGNESVIRSLIGHGRSDGLNLGFCLPRYLSRQLWFVRGAVSLSACLRTPVWKEAGPEAGKMTISWELPHLRESQLTFALSPLSVPSICMALRGLITERLSVWKQFQLSQMGEVLILILLGSTFAELLRPHPSSKSNDWTVWTSEACSTNPYLDLFSPLST
jgi:hypothetical protein